MKSTTIRLSEETRAKLDKLAKKLKRSMSDVVRLCIEHAADRLEAEETKKLGNLGPN